MYTDKILIDTVFENILVLMKKKSTLFESLRIYPSFPIFFSLS